MGALCLFAATPAGAQDERSGTEPGPLSGLALSAGENAGEGAVALSPAFAPGTLSYRASVPAGAGRVALVPSWNGQASVFAGSRRGSATFTRPVRLRSPGTAVELALAPDGGATELWVMVSGPGGLTTYTIDATAERTGAGTDAAPVRETDTAPVQELLGTVSFVSDSYRVVEQPQIVADTRAIVLQVVRSGDTSAAAGGITATPVFGTASDWDYAAVPVRLRFEAGKAITEIRYRIRSDVFIEDDETFKVALSADAGSRYRVGSPSTATVTIVDGTPVVSFARKAYTAIEGANAEVTINMSPGSVGVPVPLQVSVADSTAVHGSDYSGPRTFNVTIPAGDTSKTFSIPITDDSDVEGPETFTVTIEPAPNLFEYHPRGITVATITINDNDNEQTPPEEEPQRQVRAPASPLTAAFEGVPDEHDGTAFWLKVRFSEALGEGGVVPSPASFRVRAGKTRKVERIEAGLWRVKVKSDAWRDVTVTLAPPPGCAEEGAVCASGGRALANAPGVQVGGPVRIRLEGGKAREGKDESLDFAVTLSRAASGEVSVDYATKDGTATAGADYTAASGTLVFAAGETAKTVSVPLLDDAIDEGKETFKLRLSNPRGAYLRGIHREAKGTIRNEDPLQRDWLARFGRAAAADAVAAVTARLETPRSAGSHLTVGGQRLSLGGRGLAEALTGFARRYGAQAPADGLHERRGRPVTGRELLMGTSFRAVLGGGGSRFTGWGSGASVSRFTSAGPGLSLSGEAATGAAGMDYERGRLLTGLAMTHSLGKGTAQGSGRSYAMGSSVTTVLPYARFEFSERVSAWSLAGTGSGRLTLDLDDHAAARHGADLSMTLAAAGVRGEVVTAAGAAGFSLALKADAYWVRTESERVSVPGVGNLAGSRADASRLRAVLDGSRAFTLGGGGTLTPSVELGVRHDGGEGGSGTGMEVGAGVGWADPSRGLDVAVRVRGLAAHAGEGYREWGVSGWLRLVPGAAGRGLSMSLTPSWGADPGGSERLWAMPEASRLRAADGDAARSGRLDAEVGYGMAVLGGRFTGTPNVGFGVSDSTREYRMGWRLASVASGFELSLDATRRETPDGDGPPEHGVMLGGTVRW